MLRMAISAHRRRLPGVEGEEGEAVGDREGGVFYGQSLEAAIPSGFVCNLCELDRLVYMLPIPTKQIS